MPIGAADIEPRASTPLRVRVIGQKRGLWATTEREIMHISSSTSPPITSGRKPTKFTPERIQQIRTLVQQGIRREEIAALLDVTVGSLQVTCSRLGISLRSANGKRRASSHELAGADGHSAAPVKFFIVLRYEGTDAITELALPPATITQLALEAQFFKSSLDEFLGEIVAAATKRNLFRQVLNVNADVGPRPLPLR